MKNRNGPITLYMKKIIILFLFLFISHQLNIFYTAEGFDNPYSYSQDNKPEVWFFPVEQARWDGYRVLGREWGMLNDEQKEHYIKEALVEIETQERVIIDFKYFDKITKAFYNSMALNRLGGVKEPAITTLFIFLKMADSLKSTEKSLPLELELIRRRQGLQDDELPEVELFKVYTGYITRYKKDGKWFPEDSSPPAVGETGKYLIFSKYKTWPSRLILLSDHYPVLVDYRVISIKEINNFTDSNGLENCYYEITFEPVKKES